MATNVGINAALKRLINPNIDFNLSSINGNNLQNSIPIIRDELARYGWTMEEETESDFSTALEILLQSPSDIALIIFRPPKIGFNPIFVIAKQSNSPVRPVIIDLSFNAMGRLQQIQVPFDELDKFIEDNIRGFTLYGTFQLNKQQFGGYICTTKPSRSIGI